MTIKIKPLYVPESLRASRFSLSRTGGTLFERVSENYLEQL